MHNNSLHLFAEIGVPYLEADTDILEIGPDWAVPGGRVRPMIEGIGARYHFADIKNTPGGVFMNGDYEINSSNERYDAVVSLNVAEHVRNIWTWVKELKRITRAGGFVILVNPLSWPYHPSPYDCWRILPEGWKALFEEVGLEHVRSWSGNMVPLEPYLRGEHGPHEVTDTIAVGRVPPPGTGLLIDA